MLWVVLGPDMPLRLAHDIGAEGLQIKIDDVKEVESCYVHFHNCCPGLGPCEVAHSVGTSCTSSVCLLRVLLSVWSVCAWLGECLSV